MDLFDRLRQVTLQAQLENELPDMLADRIFGIADHPERYRDLQADIEDLIVQITQYDTFGQTGYIGMGVDHFILEGTISRLESAGRKTD